MGVLPMKKNRALEGLLVLFCFVLIIGLIFNLPQSQDEIISANGQEPHGLAWEVE